MVGKKKYSNSFMATMSNSLREFGWTTENFSYLRSFFMSGFLIINWPEYFGRFGKGRTSSLTIGPVVIFLLICKWLFGIQVLVVHHNLPGQRFPEAWSQRLLHNLASRHISLGVSPRLSEALGSEPTKLAHPAYPIIVEKQTKTFDFLSVVDETRSKEMASSSGTGLFWSRTGQIRSDMFGRGNFIVTGRLCERELQLLIARSKTLLLPWPTILNSGLAVLANQLDTLAVSLDEDFVEESITNGIAVISSQSRIPNDPCETIIIESKYNVVRKEQGFNAKALGAPLDRVLRELSGD